MKDLKTFFKEKKEKLKIAGSIASAIAIISTSSCSISDNDSNSLKQNSSDETNPYSATAKESTTSETKEITSPETTITTTTTEKIKPLTTKQTTTQETTNVTTIASTTTPFATVATPKPVETIVTTKTETTKPITVTTKPVITTTATTIAATTIPKPIEYNTRTEEIKAYYNIDLNNETKLTKYNINDYQTFLTIAYNLYSDTSIEYNKNGYNIFFTDYVVYYNLDTNEYERYVTDSTIERLIFITLLNYEYIDDNTLNKLLKIYTHDELSGVASSIPSIIGYDLNRNKYYDYSKIVVDNNLKKVLTNIQNATKNGDYKTVEKLCNDNFGKYNDMVDVLLLNYEYQLEEIQNYPTDKEAGAIGFEIIDSMGVYERAHQKTLVLQ